MTAGHALIGLARADARSAGRDSLVWTLAASPVLLGLVVRLSWPFAVTWASERGVDLEGLRPLVLGLLLTTHLPFIAGAVCALLLFDDHDDRVLIVLRVTPVTLPRYLAYRVALAFVAAALGLALCVPLAGLARLGLTVTWPALLLSAATAPLALLSISAVATDKIQAVAGMKLVGLAYVLPLAGWWLDAPWSNALLLLPTAWPVHVLWSALAGRSTPWLLVGGITVITAATVLLWRAALAHLSR